MLTKIGQFALGLTAAGLFAASGVAGTYTQANSGYNPSGTASFTDHVTTPSVTAITCNIAITNYDTMNGAGGAAFAEPQHGGTVVSAQIPSIGPGRSASNTASGSSLSADTYTLGQTWGGFPGHVYGNCSTTVTW